MSLAKEHVGRKDSIQGSYVISHSNPSTQLGSVCVLAHALTNNRIPMYGCVIIRIFSSEGKGKLLSSIFLQVYNLFCSCAMYFAVVLFFADVLNLCIIPK
jgi:hypothetical protein